MRRIKLMILILITLSLTQSCSDDELNNLSNTKWEGIIDGEKAFLSLFDTEANLIYINKGSVKYSYIYKRPEAIFTPYVVNQFNSELKAIISKDSESLTFYLMPGYFGLIVFLPL